MHKCACRFLILELVLQYYFFLSTLQRQRNDEIKTEIWCVKVTCFFEWIFPFELNKLETQQRWLSCTKDSSFHWKVVEIIFPQNKWKERNKNNLGIDQRIFYIRVSFVLFKDVLQPSLLKCLLLWSVNESSFTKRKVSCKRIYHFGRAGISKLNFLSFASCQVIVELQFRAEFFLKSSTKTDLAKTLIEKWA